MSAENQNGERSPSVNPTKVDHSIDALAKGLADGTMSRLEAVRLVGAALLGGALASVPGFAWARQESVPSSAACESYCIRNFPAGRERAQCISQGARGSGPCYECNVGLSPAAGPHLQCPPNTVFDPNAEFGTCCRTCEADAVLCQDETGENGCYSLQFRCGNGGTFDASNCQCVCPPGAALCIPGVGVSGCCVNGCQEGQTLCGGNCVSDSCPNGTRNLSTCQCDCSNGFTSCSNTCVPNCPSGQTLNPDTCLCE
jgi:hypothetical protein